MPTHSSPRTEPELTSDCSRCAGLCCTALPFSRAGGFGLDKAQDEPCRHLVVGFGCGIHDDLTRRGFPSCAVFECFGAGQQVVQRTYSGQDWRGRPDLAAEMFAVFRVTRHLHEMLALLALTGDPEPLAGQLVRIVEAAPTEILATDVDGWRQRVGARLRAVSRERRGPGPDHSGADLMGRDLRAHDLSRADLRGALLVGADLRGTRLGLADLLGADLRDAQVGGTDLSTTLFLTQPQVNAARGDPATVLPASLGRPRHWLR